MNITYLNPDFDYSLKSVMLFQDDETTSFWSDVLYYFYPKLDQEYASKLNREELNLYIEDILKTYYLEAESEIENKVISYQNHWNKYHNQIQEAFSDTFDIDVSNLFNDIKANITLNPIAPRFLEEHCFDLFYKNSDAGALGTSLHELCHFVWFYIWNDLFKDSYQEYESQSLKWILSEMVVETLLSDERLSNINPYYPRENGGCIYPYFFDMKVNDCLILDTLNDIYANNNIKDFMLKSYEYCLQNEKQIRKHIESSENQ